MVSSDNDEVTTPALKPLNSAIPTRCESVKDSMVFITINENDIMMANTSTVNVNENELYSLDDLVFKSAALVRTPND